jgi:hypothetical protein
MSRPAPPGEPAARTRTFEGVGRAALAAAAASAAAVGWLVAISVLGAVIASQALSAGSLLSWTKGALLTAALALRADAVATVRGLPIMPTPDTTVVFGWRLVPMLLTIGFLWLEGRAGRRAAERRPAGLAWPTVIAMAGAAAIAAGALAALLAVPASLSFPSLGLRIRADIGSAAASAAALAAAGAAAGAYLRAERGHLPAAALRGGLVAYGWALFLLAAGVLGLAALEPAVTAEYARGLQEQGTGGAIVFGAHVLALPGQSALLLAPASGSCLHLLDRSVDLCPWSLSPVGAGPVPSLERSVTLSPWLWVLSAVPPLAAALGGGAAARSVRERWIVAGAASGVVFAGLAVAGAWLATPWVAPDAPLIPASPVRVDLFALAFATLAWGFMGGAVGGWLEGRILSRL